MQTWYQVSFSRQLIRQSAILCCLSASVLAAALLTGCRHSRQDVSPRNLAGPVTISEWHLLGPFKMSSTTSIESNWLQASEQASHTTEWSRVVEHDYLGDIGYSETGLDNNALQALSRNSKLHLLHHQDEAYLSLHTVFPNLRYGIVYAVAEIVSSEEGDVGIGAGSDDGMSLWLNGQLLVKTPAATRRVVRRYDHLCIGHLRRGVNILLVKVDQKEGEAGLGVDLMSIAAVREAVIREREGQMIARKLLPSGEPLSLTLPTLGEEQKGSLEIRDTSGQVVWSRQGMFPPQFQTTLPLLKEGYYTCEFQTDAYRTADGFYLGDPGRVYGRLQHLREKTRDASPTALVLDALMERYEQLTRADRVRRDEANWNRKVTMVLTDGLSALSSPSGSLEWQKTRGWHFRRYLSEIDGEPQDYLMYIPAQHSQAMPVVVVMPANMDTPRRFLESAMLNDALYMDRLGRVADKTGLAVAMVYARGNSVDAPIGESDVFEAVRDIERDYPLDRERIYLFGSCAGAARALRMAAHYPDVFAGVAGYRTDTWSFEDSPQPGKVWWSGLNTPENLAPSLSNKPVLLIHGDADPEYPLKEARAAYERMRRRAGQVSFQVLPGGKHIGGTDPEGQAFEFLARQRRQNPVSTVRMVSSRLKYADSGPLRFNQADEQGSQMEGEARMDAGRLAIQTRNVAALTIRQGRLAIPAQGTPVDWNGQRAVAYLNGSSEEIRIGRPLQPQRKNSMLEGPIADAFAGPFEIVVGHGGGPAAAKSARSVAEALRATWQSVFFNSCRMREEDQVSASDLKAHHIVFVGQPSPGGRFASVLSQLPLSRGKNALSLAGRSYVGQNLTYAILQPNPLNPDRYILAIDSIEDVWALPAKELDLAHTGYYDFAVWNQSGQMIDSGLLDFEWKKAVAFPSVP